MAMNVYDYAEEKKTSTRQVFDFTLLSNPIGPSNRARSAMRSAVKTTAFCPDEETRHLRRHIARKEHVEPEEILFGHGSGLILELAFACLKPKRVLVPGPLPAHYAPLFGRHGAEAALLGHGPAEAASDMPSDDARRLATLVDGVDMLLVPSPHWMTGRLFPEETIRAMGQMLAGSGKVLVLDECLAEFSGGGYPVEKAVRSENMLILKTFSLYHALAGLRLGYALGNRRLLDRIKATVNMGPVGSVAAAAALASLRDREFQKRTAEFLKTEKTYLIDKLGRIKGVTVIDTACNFLLLGVTEGLCISDIEEQLVRRAILVEGFEGENGARFLRLPVRGRRQNAQFVKTLARTVFQLKSGGSAGGAV
jgi:threonine-phosphate decarboxylase